jgi:PIN domain nuclease of toxin-antitoxin system
MLNGIADTHTVIWYIFGDKRLSPAARDFIEKSAADSDQVGISSITLVEVVYLAEKGRISGETFDRLMDTIDKPDSVLVEVALDRDIVLSVAAINRSEVPDMPDRIIAATALSLGIPLISRDGKIQASSIKTIW